MRQQAPRRDRPRKALWTAWAVLFLLVAVELAAILFQNSGLLVYTGDDSYIHLALAENLAGGHYGVNPGEVSAASSSILWPLLLAPFAGLELGYLAPFFLNLAAAVATLYFFWRIVALSFAAQGGQDSKSHAVVTVLLLLLIPATNLIGLIFVGMEHALQVLLVAAIVWGLVREIEVGEASPWLFPALVVAPLIRYESFAVALPALAGLFLRGYRRQALVAGVTLVALAGAFSAFLLRLGLEPFPNSVLMKSPVVAASSSSGVLGNLWRQLSGPQGLLLGLSTLYLLTVALYGKKRKRGERLLAATIALALVLHLVVGRSGYQRYEVYICTAAFLAILYLGPKSFAELPVKPRFFKTDRVTILLMVALCVPYGGALFIIPLASNNIYEQHYQMHRFVVEYYKKPVATSDLGYVSYRNDHYVLDLAGLASMKIFHDRLEDSSETWMADTLRAHGVRLAMVYLPYTPPPEGWQRAGELRLGKRRVAPAFATVSLYTFGQDTLLEVRSLMEDFRPTLPAGVELVTFSVEP